jgi:hypothetical protein
MGMIPIDRMWERVEIARQDSDTSLFLSLLYCAEMILKIVAAGLVAAIEDDRERHRYRQAHRLVRADGIGDWASAVDDILTGPAAQHLVEEAREEQRELTSKNTMGTWQYDSVSSIHACICLIDPNCERLPAKVDGRRWLSLFATLRNKTRGHGAPPSELYCKLSPLLEKSIRTFADGFRLFKRPWAYLYRNLSGKYRVTKLTQPGTEFDTLKTRSAIVNLQDGIYVYFDQQAQVELMYSGVDALDFLFPNGAFNDKKFELISYITNSTREADASSYLSPATPLPESETQGIGSLEVQGKCFGNLPPVQHGYIHRSGLEIELSNALMNDRHPIITLVGRGGIGKTWLTLTVLHQVASDDRFAAILWFSARDIDLMPQGPKLVTPHVLTANDIASEFVRLVNPEDSREKGFNASKYLGQTMTNSSVGPVLFVFDNFETARVPFELYSWIDTYIRLPNKVLITSRIREFKGDYPIEVLGMNEVESEDLINSTAELLGIKQLLTEDYRRELYQESSGHPYVMKVLLGEVAKIGRLAKVERIVATIDNILDALFERTYSGLSPVAKRVFLTLCSWRSTVPLLALEAVLLRPANERMDVANAAEELSRSSFVEISTSRQDNELFLTVPLVAAVFGKPKLATSPMRSAVEADLQLLHAFGATQQADIKWGITPRIEKLFRYIADRISQGKDTVDGHQPMLEFIARKYPPAWLLLARLHQELESARDLEKAKEATRRYIEHTPKDYAHQEQAWSKLANLCQTTGDTVGEIHALVEMCQPSDVPFRTVSDAVNRVNALFIKQHFVLDSDEKRIVSQKLAQVMENRISEGDATDCSRLAWLFLRLQDEEKAQGIVELGISLDPENPHCKNLATRLSNHSL